MNFRTVSTAEELPVEITDFKRRHYHEVFGRRWREVYDKSPLLIDGESVLIAEVDERPAGWVQYRISSPYELKFRGFAVQPGFRGRWIARQLMHELVCRAEIFHITMGIAREKPSDINLMYLTSLIYLDLHGLRESVKFGQFLRKMKFKPCKFNKSQLDPEELAALEIYEEQCAGASRVFRRLVVNDGVELKPEAKDELRRLTPDQLQVVMHGLDVKLGNFKRSGRVSYRYDLCPICEHMGSSEQDDSACRRCFIYKTCMEPFREVGRFKEDHQISAAYFEEMRRFLKKHFG